MSTPQRDRKAARRRKRQATKAVRDRITWTATIPVELTLSSGSGDPLDYDCPDPECRAPAGMPCIPTPLEDNRPAGTAKKEAP